VLFEDVALFEFGVLAEVFGLDRSDDGVPKLDFRVCALEPGKPLSALGGTKVIAPYGLEGLLGADLVAIPATRIRGDYPPEVLEALRQAAARGATMLSVCWMGAVARRTGGMPRSWRSFTRLPRSTRTSSSSTMAT
jgi:transcriptional regulator GlxA family with amidase domain